jgi:hypothetical protein
VLRSLIATKTLCVVPVWLWPVWLAAVDGKAPVKGFTQARDPKPFALPLP